MDSRIRSHERRARSAGDDPESQARLLLERVRAGRLSRERLELAAYCGDAGARMALDVEAMPSWPECACGRPGDDRACVKCGPDATLKALVGGLDWTWGTDALVRASLAAIGPAAEAEHARRAAAGRDSVRRQVKVIREAMTRWLEAPGAEQRRAAAQEWASLTEWAIDRPEFLPRLRLPNVVERAPVVKRRALVEAIEAAAERTQPRVIFDAICSALTRWALGDA